MDWKSIDIYGSIDVTSDAHMQLSCAEGNSTEELNKSYQSIDAFEVIDKHVSILDLDVYLA